MMRSFKSQDFEIDLVKEVRRREVARRLSQRQQGFNNILKQSILIGMNPFNCYIHNCNIRNKILKILLEPYLPNNDLKNLLISFLNEMTDLKQQLICYEINNIAIVWEKRVSIVMVGFEFEEEYWSWWVTEKYIHQLSMNKVLETWQENYKEEVSKGLYWFKEDFSNVKEPYRVWTLHQSRVEGDGIVLFNKCKEYEMDSDFSMNY